MKLSLAVGFGTSEVLSHSIFANSGAQKSKVCISKTVTWTSLTWICTYYCFAHCNTLIQWPLIQDKFCFQKGKIYSKNKNMNFHLGIGQYLYCFVWRSSVEVCSSLMWPRPGNALAPLNLAHCGSMANS